MKTTILALALLATVLPADAALACPPMLPGSVPPTEEQMLTRSLRGMTDIVYGVVVRSGVKPGEPSRFKVIHVYRGTLQKGQVIEAPPGWGHPLPYCVGMMGPAPVKPVGAYGVIAFARPYPSLEFIGPKHVQLMIRNGWIKSAQAR